MQKESRNTVWSMFAVMFGAPILLYLTRPLWHGFFMAFYRHPLVFISVAAFFIASLAGAIGAVMRQERAKRENKRVKEGFGPIAKVFVVLSALTLVFYTITGAAFRAEKIVSTIEYEKISALPDSPQARILPLAVAKQFGCDALQEPTQRPYGWQPVTWRGKFSWATPRTPDGIWRVLSKRAEGLEIIDATTMERGVSFANQTLEVSEGVRFTNNIYWRIYKKHYFVDVSEIFYAEHDNNLVAIAPIIAYEGFPIRMPVFGGCFLVYPDGTLKELSAKEAATHPAVIAAGRVFPEELAKMYHDAYKFKKGIWNKWFVHEDQIKINDPPDEENGQPYLFPTAHGTVWLSAASPYGDSEGVFKIFLTDGLTGKTSVMEMPKQSALTGPAQAIGYVKSVHPTYNWATRNEKSSAGNIVAIEPRPHVKNGNLFWMVSITTTEHKGVKETAFVNAHTNQVLSFSSDKEVAAFLSGTEQVSRPVAAKKGGDGSLKQDKLDRIEKMLQDALQELQELKKSK